MVTDEESPVAPTFNTTLMLPDEVYLEFPVAANAYPVVAKSIVATNINDNTALSIFFLVFIIVLSIFQAFVVMALCHN